MTQTPTSPARPAAPARRRNTVLDYAIIIVVAVAVAFVLQAFVVKPYRIPSESMVPTLLTGDRVLVNRFIYHFQKPARGDIVVFRYPLDTHVTFIKRLIGLPGDTLSLQGGKVFVNGKPIDEPYIAKINGQPVPTEPYGAIDGTTMSQPWSLNQPYTLKPSEYFMMGDNRLKSDDSRDWGPVPAKDLIGKAFFIYWPPSRIGLP